MPQPAGKFYLLTLKGPHMALNSANIANPKYNLDFPSPAKDIATDMDRQAIIDLVKACALKAPGGKLNHLVFNCHSAGGVLKIGTWFDRYNSPGLFGQLNGKVGVVWLQSCNACNGADGEALCTGIATSAKCHVVSYFLSVVQTKTQLKKGQIDFDTNSIPKVLVPGGPTTFDKDKSVIFFKKLPMIVRTFEAIESKGKP